MREWVKESKTETDRPVDEVNELIDETEVIGIWLGCISLDVMNNASKHVLRARTEKQNVNWI